MKASLLVAALIALAILSCGKKAHAADIGCDIGVYSKYINGIGSLVGKNHEPVIQGDCRYNFANGAYVDGWVSQSLRDPGLSKTYANEIDLTVGYEKKLSEKWSADLHLAYFDIANQRLMNGVNGDLLNGGGTLRYQVTTDTKVYANLEGYHGIGDQGLPGGWRGGLGVRTLLGPIVVDGTLYHNQNFLGHGQFVKVMLEPKAPIAKLAGGEIRPTVFFYKPIGVYDKTHSNQVVGAIHITW